MARTALAILVIGALAAAEAARVQSDPKLRSSRVSSARDQQGSDEVESIPGAELTSRHFAGQALPHIKLHALATLSAALPLVFCLSYPSCPCQNTT